jgi:uncharacterized protein (DUF885 family)
LTVLWIGVAIATGLLAAADAGISEQPSEMRVYIERYAADRGLLHRAYSVELSPARRARMRKFYAEWLGRLPALNFDSMRQDGQVDYVLFRNHLQHELRQLERRERELSETAPLLPFAGAILALDESRRRMENPDPKKAAAAVHELNKQIIGIHESAEASLKAAPANRTVANRAATESAELRGILKRWFDFYNGYDPLFTWWVGEAWRRADASLQKYAVFLRERVAGVKGGGADLDPAGSRDESAAAGRRFVTSSAKSDSTEDIIGTPIGRDGLISELVHEMIPYTPEELIAIANREFAWCEDQMKKASRELGFGDDWKKALEHVKNLYVEPGKQPALVRDLEKEAEVFLDKHDLITIPPLARETWRMQMMTPERQLINPFFTGGEVMSVSFPVDSMTYEQKLMSMRGNNIHFSRATVFHELIPGHELQAFMAARYRPYRTLFGTPFTVEGWALYWEMLLWDMKFHSSPEDRVGALFWRMHRCARIVFSLGFHLGQMTPQQCVDFLVDRVGHERDNAIGEVRRSFATSYSPLYQAAYLLGGLQFYALRKELVESGKMTYRQFHDTILTLNRIPVELIRASLTNQKLSRDYSSVWKFYGAVSASN